MSVLESWSVVESWVLCKRVVGWLLTYLVMSVLTCQVSW